LIFQGVIFKDKNDSLAYKASNSADRHVCTQTHYKSCMIDSNSTTPMRQHSHYKFWRQAYKNHLLTYVLIYLLRFRRAAMTVKL